MDQKKYIVLKYSIKIKEIEITRESDSSYWTARNDWKGRRVEVRELKNSTYQQTFDTREDAIQHLIERTERQIKQTIDIMAIHEDNLETLKKQ